MRVAAPRSGNERWMAPVNMPYRTGANIGLGVEVSGSLPGDWMDWDGEPEVVFGYGSRFEVVYVCS
jgi:hypothetical protein